MDNDDETDPFAGLTISSSPPSSRPTSSPTPKEIQQPRGAQSEAEFQEVKRTYRPKIENGEVGFPPTLNFFFQKKKNLVSLYLLLWCGIPTVHTSVPASAEGKGMEVCMYVCGQVGRQAGRE